MTNRGTSFSGYWLGPNVFAPRVIDALTPYVLTYASTCRSPPAFAALYGLEGRSGSVSAARPPASRSPYTSSVDTWTNRASFARAQSSNVIVPRTSVETNSFGPRIERSTCVSAAKLTIALQPTAARPTASGSAMSPTTSSAATPSRLAGFPA